MPVGLSYYVISRAAYAMATAQTIAHDSQSSVLLFRITNMLL